MAGKWFLPAKGETLVDEAFRLLRQYAAGEVRFLVPDLFWAELDNLFWKAMRQKRWTLTSAEAALTAARTQAAHRGLCGSARAGIPDCDRF